MGKEAGSTSIASLESVFRSDIPVRDKFLSRLFGIFNEEVVRHWAACPQAPYMNYGRPTLYQPEHTRGYTLDFTLCEKHSGKIFVAEMKCELELGNYRYLRLSSPEQLDHHRNPAFQHFLRAAVEPRAMRAMVNGNPIPIDGAVLVWGALDDLGADHVKQAFGFADVLSVESMVRDLVRWRPPQWLRFVSHREQWSGDFFTYLTYGNVTPPGSAGA